jgi:tetratricopeptide (TPR) repeat protein
MSEFLIGRNNELSTLDSALTETAHGQGGVVLISGERGIGKTAILNALCLRATAVNFRVLRADCAARYRTELSPPWVYAIRNNLVSTPPNEIDSRGLTDFRTFNEPCEKDGARLEPLDPPRNRFRLGCDNVSFFQYLPRLLEIETRQHPLLLAVDDLQDADESAQGLVRLANEDFRKLRVLLAAVCSPPTIPPSPAALSPPAISSRKYSRHIELTGLSPRATGELCSQVLQHVLDEAMIQRIHDLSGGNPWLILEIAQSILRQGSTDLSNPFPDGVREAIHAATKKRLEALSSETRKLLGVASVVGARFASQVLFDVRSLSRDRGSAALLEAERADFIRPVAPNHYCFVKGIDKRVLYEEFSSTQRTSLHLEIAATLEASAVQDGEADVGDVALHLLASRDTKAIRRALELALMAASRSTATMDYQGAIIMYSIALEALDLSSHSDEPRRCDILMALAQAQQHAGDIAAAQESLYHAAEIAQRSGDWRRLADIVLAAPTLHWPCPGRPNGLVTMLAERVLNLLPEQDVTRRALLMARWAAELSHFPEERKRSERLSQRALKIFHESAEPSKLHLLRLRDAVLRRPELLSERLTNSAEVIRIARGLGDWVAVFEGEWARNVTLFQLGSPTGLDNGLETLEHAALMAGPNYQCYVPAFAAVQAFFDGRFSEGEQLVASCREMAAACGFTELADQLWPAMMMPLDEQGRLAELEPLVTRWLRTSPTSTSVRVVRCWLAARLGKTSEARFQLERLAASNFAALKDSRGQLVEAAVLTEVCIQLRDVPHHAAALYQLLRPHEKRIVVLEPFANFGAVSRYLGKLALTLSRIEEAIRHLQTAAEFNNRIGARAWTAHASHELALALLARGYSGDRPVALSLLTNARAEATIMGMERLARTINSSLDQLEVNDSDVMIGADGNHSRSDVAEFKGTPGQGTAGDVGFSPPLNLATFYTEKESSLQLLDDRRTPNTIFLFETDHWTIGYDGMVIRLGSLKGLNLIAYLLARPNQDIHALELDRLVGLGPLATSTDVDNPIGASDLGPMLDHTAKQAYRRRIHALREDLEEARSFNDFERAARIEEEIRAIARELSRAMGLTGRDRKIASDTERARLRVASAIRWAINKISNQHSALGRFLSLSIKTGTLCSYRPDSNAIPDWNL